MLDPGSEGRGGFVWFERTGTSHLHSGRQLVLVISLYLTILRLLL